jgi:phage terminase Nu1 subunit (DNA packaging protein)
VTRLVSRESLGELWGIPPKTLAKWASEGTGPPYYRLGRAARYDLDAATRWLETKRAGVPEVRSPAARSSSTGRLRAVARGGGP